MERTSVNRVLINKHHHRTPEAPRVPPESLITEAH